MILNTLLVRIRSGIKTLNQSRRIRSRLFAGSPLILSIGRREHRGRVSMSLLYKNGLILTLGEEGILDFQDKDFSQFLDSPGFSNRDALTLLHKIILKSLIRYMVHPSLDQGQRERAAEAASKLYLAEVEATTDWAPGPAAAVIHQSFQEKSTVRR